MPDNTRRHDRPDAPYKARAQIFFNSRERCRKHGFEGFNLELPAEAWMVDPLALHAELFPDPRRGKASGKGNRLFLVRQLQPADGIAIVGIGKNNLLKLSGDRFCHGLEGN